MIKEADLLEAIAECQGERNPNANTCRNLAAYYTILDHIQKRETIPIMESYSYSNGPVKYSSESEFGRIVKNKELVQIMPLIDELMTTIQVIQPRLYDAVIMKLKET